MWKWPSAPVLKDMPMPPPATPLLLRAERREGDGEGGRFGADGSDVLRSPRRSPARALPALERAGPPPAGSEVSASPGASEMGTGGGAGASASARAAAVASSSAALAPSTSARSSASSARSPAAPAALAARPSSTVHRSRRASTSSRSSSSPRPTAPAARSPPSSCTCSPRPPAPSAPSTPSAPSPAPPTLPLPPPPSRAGSSLRRRSPRSLAPSALAAPACSGAATAAATALLHSANSRVSARAPAARRASSAWPPGSPVRISAHCARARHGGAPLREGARAWRIASLAPSACCSWAARAACSSPRVTAARSDRMMSDCALAPAVSARATARVGPARTHTHGAPGARSAGGRLAPVRRSPP